MLEKLKASYKLWHSYIGTLPKTSRYTLGETIDKYYLHTIESIVTASFLSKQDKTPFVRKAIISLDVLKFFLFTAWELRALDNKKYAALSDPLSEAGKMLGGWHNQLVKQNSPTKVGEK